MILPIVRGLVEEGMESLDIKLSLLRKGWLCETIFVTLLKTRFDK
jgi:hypothetical protein